MTDDVTRPFDARRRAAAAGGRPAPARPCPTCVRARLLSRGLIAYGVIGLVVAVLGLGAAALGQRRGSTPRATGSTTTIGAARRRRWTGPPTALHDASTTAADVQHDARPDRRRRSPAAADTIIGVRTSLDDLEGVLRSVNILGAHRRSAGGRRRRRRSPRASSGLDQRLTAIVDGSLQANRDALAANADSLGGARRQHRGLGRPAAIAASSRIRSPTSSVVIVLMLVFVMWALVPAIGALRARGLAAARARGAAARLRAARSVSAARGAGRSGRRAARPSRGRRRRAASMTSRGTARRRRDTGRATATAGRRAGGCPGCRR